MKTLSVILFVSLAACDARFVPSEEYEPPTRYVVRTDYEDLSEATAKCAGEDLATGGGCLSPMPHHAAGIPVENDFGEPIGMHCVAEDFGIPVQAFAICVTGGEE